MRAFDPEQLVADCRLALADPDPVGAVAAIVERAVADPRAIAQVTPVPVDPDDDGIIHQSPELFIANVLFPAGLVTGIHDHGIPAVIGVWSGFEDNLRYRRTATGLASRAARRVEMGEVLVLGVDDLHDVHAPSAAWSGALHVYLGDLPGRARSWWPDASAAPQAYDGDVAEANWGRLARDTGLLRSS